MSMLRRPVLVKFAPHETKDAISYHICFDGGVVVEGECRVVRWTREAEPFLFSPPLRRAMRVFNLPSGWRVSVEVVVTKDTSSMREGHKVLTIDRP